MSKQEHPYAEILRAIADGEDVQWLSGVGRWLDVSCSQLLHDIANNSTILKDYRVKPKTIRINGFDVPEPLMMVPEVNTAVFIADPCNISLVVEFRTGGGSLSKEKFNTGLCHSTKEAAVLHAKALLSFTATMGE